MTLIRFGMEFRAADESGSGRLVGHASVFGQVAEVRGGYERIAPEAFDRALAEKHDVALLVNHDGLPLARTTSGTLRLGKDAEGLTVDADMADTTLGRDVRLLMERGDLKSMSFGFVPTAHRFVNVDGYQVREYTDLDLFDVSVVTHPAYDQATAQLRALTPSSAYTAAQRQHTLIRAKALIAQKEGK